MIGQGVNIEAIRELNKLRVYAITNNGDTDPNYGKNGEVFSAYMTQSLGQLGGSVEASSLTEDVGNAIKSLGFVGKIVDTVVDTRLGEFIKNHPTLTNVIGQSSNLANKINYNYNYRFSNVSKFSTSFNCELVVKDDVYEDVFFPLWRILKYVLPDETEQLRDTELFGKGKEKVSKVGGMVKDALGNVLEPNALDWLWDKVSTVVGEGEDMLGGLSIYEKPEQLSDNISHSRILIGNRISIDNVIITGVTFKVPYLYYEDGLFDKVDVTLTVEGNRQQSVKTYDWVRTLVEEYGAGIGNSRNNTLNSQFEA